MTGIYIYIYINCATFIESNPKASISIDVGEDATPFPRLLHFTLDPYPIVLNAK